MYAAKARFVALLPSSATGYVLLFDGKVVSGPDAASYTLKQAQENCAYNRRSKPGIEVDCRYNGAAF